MPRYFVSAHLSDLGSALVRDHGLDAAEKATRSSLEERGCTLVNMYLGFEDGARHYIVFDTPDEITVHALALQATANPIYERMPDQLVRLVSIDEAREVVNKMKSWPAPPAPPEMPGQ
jgi:hypothetical protein